MEDKFVLDSFAMLCFLEDEPGAEEVHKLLNAAATGTCQLNMTVVNLAEVIYTVTRHEGQEQASEVLSLLESFPINFEEIDKELALIAADIKSRFSIALGDCFCITSAKNHSATAVTGDPEFKEVTHEIKIKWLPEKTEEKTDLI